MSLLLDSSICVAYLRGRDPAVRDRLLARPTGEFRLCSVVKAELLYGARRSAHVGENLRRLQRFFEPFLSLPFDDEAAQRYAVLRAELERTGSVIGGNDMMIAAIALAGDLTLVTRNQAEFRRVAGLRLDAW